MKKVLIANRGEIALRIMKTLRSMNIQSVAVYSDADKDAPFVNYADEAYCIGDAKPSESYLNMDKILGVATTVKADGIHPGYGFLSENAEFASRVAAAGIKFIGPTLEAIRIMGDKLSAKQAVKKYEVPMVPGTDSAIQDIESGIKIAREVGYPILIKASAGGGGKGMRTVEREEDFAQQFERASSEALSSFGNGAVFIEKFVQQPKHIEIQVIADQHGHVLYLNERECSIQRRHQKLVEEAPSPVVDSALRKKMGEAAVNVARSCNYEGVGTVEFLVDKDRNFYFLEMNTRLQVEHPVTEMITGLDLVEEQIKVARGEKLSYTQDEVKLDGHAIEVRICAEDPENNFLPDLGKIIRYRRPTGLGIRVDDAYDEGMNIPIMYDPMIAKLIVHAKDRDSAIEKMIQAIDQFEICGFSTTLGFCRFALNHAEFRNGKFTINFVADHFKPEYLKAEVNEDISASAYALFKKIKNDAEPVYLDQKYSAWKTNR
ncbi:MAG: acetyl-CoA carboxylase biotin carboxylase subunit [Crocinitomicaceae bacterium]|nr:acetyl-CoA carboxylase biotin carboxylase subunit [Crocinitomicaceae bacterium]MBK8924631.1 acetyl-CoA carboxylase biotin carboxylase subunit [Crocinitomicaceae bacterium]